MGAQDPQDGGTERKVYVTPEITRVPLRPQEAVLGFCKTTTSQGVGNADCDTGAPACFSPGS